ncbi:MAG: hypothetical protein M0009_09710 [Deltaproteobacteria bacterium]|nr:hypothetical protein [Deltaproteobacteria bacterium]
MSAGGTIEGRTAIHDHGIRKAFLIPLGLDAFLLLVLLLIALLLRGDGVEKLIFSLFFLIALALFLEGLFRRVGVTETGLSFRKLGRKKTVAWAEITHVGCLTLHKKVYLLLTTVKGFFVISNVYEGFSALVEEIVVHVEPDRVEEEVRLLAGRSGLGIAPIVSSWIAALLMIGIIAMKLFPLLG